MSIRLKNVDKFCVCSNEQIFNILIMKNEKYGTFVSEAGKLMNSCKRARLSDVHIFYDFKPRW